MSELSLYIHIPFCRSKCGYCSFTSFANRDRDIPIYIEVLIKEITLTHRPGVSVKTIYFGGGTPSILSYIDIRTILQTIHECYTIETGAEVTFEANPGTVDSQYLLSLRDLGINRLSLGVQSLDDAELAELGRCHSVSEARTAVREARQAGFNNLSLDFIYGLPGRQIRGWEFMLNEIVELDVEHLSLYGLTLEPDTPLGIALGRGEYPAADPDQAATEYEMASAKLEAAGYRHYEISNWARPGYESRHNTVYWQRGEYLGLGVAAHSFIGGQRIGNTPDLNSYIKSLSAGDLPARDVEVIGDGAALSEAMFLRLRLEEGVSLDDTGWQFSIDLRSRYAAEITELSGLGLVEVSADRLRLTPRGRLLGNEVFIRFLPS